MTKGKFLKILGIITMFISISIMSYHYFSESEKTDYILNGLVMTIIGLVIVASGNKYEKS
jgi:uncharacterized membrane protein